MPAAWQRPSQLADQILGPGLWSGFWHEEMIEKNGTLHIKENTRAVSSHRHHTSDNAY